MTGRRMVLAIAIGSLLAAAWPAALAHRADQQAAGGAELIVFVSTEEQNSRPMRRVSVSLQAGELGVPRTAITDDDGRVVFSALAPTNYLISAGKAAYVRTFYGSKTPGMGPGTAVALVAGQRLELRMRLIKGSVISGTVRSPGGRPAANVIVQANNRRWSRNRQVSMFAESQQSLSTTDDRGVYRLFGLPPGDYVLSVQGASVREELRVITDQELQWADKVVAGGAAPAPASYPDAPPAAPRSAFSPVYYPGTTVGTDATVLTLGPAEERLGVDFTLQLVRTAQVRGRLVDPDGRPQPNQSVMLRAAQSSSPSEVLELIELIIGDSVRTGADGTFTMNGVRPGRYTLTARATPRTGNEPPPGGAGRGGAAATQAAALAAAGIGGGTGTHWATEDITVAGVDLPELTLMLRPGRTVSGRLAYEGTTLTPPKEMNSVVLMLSPAESAGSVAQMAASMITGMRIPVAADGTFSTTGVAPGRYRLATQASVLGSLAPTAAASAGGWVLKSVLVGGRDIADSALEVTASDDVSGVVVTFTDRPTELSGTVVDQAGRPTSTFPIVVFSTDRAYWTAGSRRAQIVRPATDGTFTVVGLPAGEYFVSAVTAIEQDQLSDASFLDQLAAASFKIRLADGEKKTQDLKLGGG